MITNDSEGQLITVSTAPAGRYYVATGLDPAKTYTVTLEGERIGTAPFTLRLRRNSDTPSYRPAPNGHFEVQVTGATRYELLFYSDTAGAQYRIRSLVMDECVTCKTDTDLRNEILAQTPGLQAELDAGHTWDAAKLILGWAAPRIAYAGSQSALVDTSAISAAQAYYDVFQQRKGGVWCGGATDWFRKVLALFGIDSFRYDFGTASGDLTHVTTVLPFAKGDGTTDYRVLDPTFNMDLTITTSGKAASVPAIWELWRADKSQYVQRNEGGLGTRQVLFAPADADGRFTSAPCTSVSSNGGCGFDSFLANSAGAFAANGMEQGFDGFVQLMSTKELFNPAFNGVPQDFQNKHATFKDAVLTGKDDVHVSELPIAPESSAPPQISGSNAVGGTLTATNGSWDSSTPIDQYDRQWARCDADGTGCADISGATSPSYSPVQADAGKRLRFSIRAHNDDGWSEPPARAMTSDTTGFGNAPHYASQPGLTGTAADTEVLFITGGSWTGTQPFDWAYEWYRCEADGTGCVQIPNATADRRRVTTADIGKRIKARMIISNAWGSDTGETPLTDAVVGAPPKASMAPTISGTFRDGEVAILSGNGWWGTPTSYSYQWVRCDGSGNNCADIAGATTDRRRFNTADVNMRLKLRMTAHNAYGSTPADSALTPPIAGAPPSNLSPPTITGTAKVNQVVSVQSVGSWTGTPSWSYSYQWQKCNSAGTSCTDIAGANTDRRRVAQSDRGGRLRVRVTATSVWGSGSAVSAVTDLIP